MRFFAKQKVPGADSINQIIGYEGIVSRYYFDMLSSCIEEKFFFLGRSRRPAKDPFNCMLNMGYSMLSKEICGELESRNLNPFIGFIHQDKRGHPALGSDLIEEWRPVIVDSVVLSLIQGHEISLSEFSESSGGVQMSEKATRILISKMEKKMETKSSYLTYIRRTVSFREALWHQAERKSRAIDSEDVTLYKPVIVM